MEMAHVMKVKAAGMPAMVAHYARKPEMNGYHRPNIDPGRTGQNYVVGSTDPDALAREVVARVKAAEERHREVSGRRVRRDANVLADWVITLPEDCPPEMEVRFFESVVGFCRGRYGARNVPGGFVHRDESRDHVHVPVIPAMDDGRLNAKEKINRRDLQTFHKDLSDYLEKALGRRVSVLLDPDARAEKALSDVKDRKALTIVRERADHDREVAATARREAARAGREMVAAQDRAIDAQADADRARADARAARVEAERARSERDRAQADAERMRAQADAAREQGAAATAAAKDARERERAARESEAEAHRAADAAREQAERARENAARARREAESARADAAKARREADRARAELDGLRAQLAAARAELARVRGEMDRVLSRAKASFRAWWRGLRQEPDLDRMAREAARAMADAIREAGLVDPDRDEPCR